MNMPNFVVGGTSRQAIWWFKFPTISSIDLRKQLINFAV
jgi:hypothetical protein